MKEGNLITKRVTLPLPNDTSICWGTVGHRESLG